MKTIHIGIDTGMNTGIAVWYEHQKSFWEISTKKIHKAIEDVENLQKFVDSKNTEPTSLVVYFEDARLRKWYGNADRERLQGAGSVKRDAKIWEDFLTEKRIKFFAVPPKNNRTKLTSAQFAKLTGYSGRTTEHSRDAAMLVWGR